MIIGLINSENKLASPIEIEHEGFESLTDEQRKEYGFMPCEKVYGDEPKEGEQYVCNGISHRVDRLRAHFRASSDEEVISRSELILSALDTFKTLLMDKLDTMDVIEALQSIQENLELTCSTIHDIYYPVIDIEPDEETEPVIEV